MLTTLRVKSVYSSLNSKIKNKVFRCLLRCKSWIYDILDKFEELTKGATLNKVFYGVYESVRSVFLRDNAQFNAYRVYKQDLK